MWGNGEGAGMIPFAFDFETALIGPGCLAPRATCLTWQAKGEPPGILHALDPECEKLLQAVLEDPDALLIGHNVAFDMGVICANYPKLLPLVFQAYEADRVTDTMLRQKLLDIAGGCYRKRPNADGVWKAVNYDLAFCASRLLGKPIKKEGFRLFYQFFRDVPLKDWEAQAKFLQAYLPAHPDVLTEEQLKQLPGMLAADPKEALSYPLEDAVVTLGVWEAQEQHAQYLEDQYRLARAAWWMHLMSAYGLHTDAGAVHALRVETENLQEEIKARLVEAGLVRKDGSRDTKLAKSYMEELCRQQGKTPRLTEKLQTSLDADACEASEDPLLEDYAQFTNLSAVLDKDIPMLMGGVLHPIHSRYDIAETGRTTSSKPAIQNLRTSVGIRECIRPRPGCVYAQADYEGLELHTLAQACLVLVGKSRLADLLNAGLDPHMEVARVILGCTYDEAKIRGTADPEVYLARQTGKVANFGFPGGLGIARLIQFAKKLYNVTLTESEAKHLKDVWLSTLPEMHAYFDYVNRLPEGAYGRSMEQVYTKRFRGGASFCAAANGYFQGLGSDVAKHAGWLLCKACYNEPTSVLFGSRIVAFIHDEFILEVKDDELAHDKALELSRLMILGADKYLPNVKAKAPPQLMAYWSKKAEAVHDERGRLIPWRGLI